MTLSWYGEPVSGVLERTMSKYNRYLVSFIAVLGIYLCILLPLCQRLTRGVPFRISVGAWTIESPFVVAALLIGAALAIGTAVAAKHIVVAWTVNSVCFVILKAVGAVEKLKAKR